MNSHQQDNFTFAVWHFKADVAAAKRFHRTNAKGKTEQQLVCECAAYEQGFNDALAKLAELNALPKFAAPTQG